MILFDIVYKYGFWKNILKIKYESPHKKSRVPGSSIFTTLTYHLTIDSHRGCLFYCTSCWFRFHIFSWTAGRQKTVDCQIIWHYTNNKTPKIWCNKNHTIKVVCTSRCLLQVGVVSKEWSRCKSFVCVSLAKHRHGKKPASCVVLLSKWLDLLNQLKSNVVALSSCEHMRNSSAWMWRKKLALNVVFFLKNCTALHVISTLQFNMCVSLFHSWLCYRTWPQPISGCWSCEPTKQYTTSWPSIPTTATFFMSWHLIM